MTDRPEYYELQAAVARLAALPPVKTAQERAQSVIDELCASPFVWATHELPGETKLGIIKDAIERAITEAQDAVR